MEQDFTPELGDSIIEAVSEETRNKLQSDPMFQLQHEKEDKEKSRTAKDRLASLMDLSMNTTREDYDINSLLRKKNRTDRKRSRELLEEGQSRGLSIALVEVNEDDVARAKEVMGRRKHRTGGSSSFNVSERARQTHIISESIFSKSKPHIAPARAGGNVDRLLSQPQFSERHMSSAARAHQVHVKAMQKAAERNIRVKGLKLTVEGCTDAKPGVTVHRAEARTSVARDDSKRGVTENAPAVATPLVHALDMLTGYGDEDDSS